MVTNEMIEVCLQPIQEKYIKVSLLQNFFITESGKKVRKHRKVGEVHGNVVGGSINIDANSAIRRTCSIDMTITDNSFLIGEDRKIWLDKWVGIEIGIKHLITGNIIWFDYGVYVINNPSVVYDISEKRLSFSGMDLMSTLDGSRGGQLGIVTKLTSGATTSDAIKTTVNSLGGISLNDIYIEQNNQTLPYDIEKTSTDTVYSILEEIRGLYIDWEFFFDVEGRFIYRKIKNRYATNPLPNYENDIISFNFLKEHELVVDYSHNLLFDNVKNKIKVWGKLKDNGEQVYAELANTNPQSPFNINKDFGEVLYTVVDDKIFDNNQAQIRCQYELYIHNNMNERVSAIAIPLYFLNVNHLIEFNQTEIELEGKYLIDNINFGLEPISTMSINAHKIYEVD